jgi:hypothetical protein
MLRTRISGRSRSRQPVLFQDGHWTEDAESHPESRLGGPRASSGVSSHEEGIFRATVRRSLKNVEILDTLVKEHQWNHSLHDLR